MNSQRASSLVSVIIPCYNHGHFLADAIDSVLAQTWHPIELIVVDDGSSDTTEEVARGYPAVHYIHQTNQGLSAARNTGIRHSKGDFLVFLDADDWLYADGIAFNVDQLLQHPEAAFVSGAHSRSDVAKNIQSEVEFTVTTDHYRHLLEGNYIGMHATVLYRRAVFDRFLFDTTLKACEDYDLYLKITRQNPVVHHTHQIASYRIHDANMSADIPMMLNRVLHVLSRQEKELQTPLEVTSYRKGQQNWRDYYCIVLYNLLIANQYTRNKMARNDAFNLLIKHKPALYTRYWMAKSWSVTKGALKKYTPSSTLRWLYKMGRNPNFHPPVGAVRLGDFNRSRPFSTQFGYDRGGPVDRYYIENFLHRQAPSIQGRVLEIGDNDYTLQFGQSQVTKSDILHVHGGNPQATFIGDISDAPHIPSASFDCIILTQTLHLIYNIKSALQTCERILKPGGVLLLTVPGISHIDHDEWGDNWLWAFTATSIRRLLLEVFPPASVEINTYGNVFIATAFLYGMGASEVTPDQLNFEDPHYQVIITAKATKPLLP
jgi:glycosyltransferase involved in cell wall biosynthesis